MLYGPALCDGGTGGAVVNGTEEYALSTRGKHRGAGRARFHESGRFEFPDVSDRSHYLTRGPSLAGQLAAMGATLPCRISKHTEQRQHNGDSPRWNCGCHRLLFRFGYRGRFSYELLF